MNIKVICIFIFSIELDYLNIFSVNCLCFQQFFVYISEENVIPVH